MQFVERYDDGLDQVVVLRYAAAFYWLMWPTFAVTIWAWFITTLIPVFPHLLLGVLYCSQLFLIGLSASNLSDECALKEYMLPVPNIRSKIR